MLAYVRFSGTRPVVRAALERLGAVIDESAAYDVFTVALPPSALAALARLPGVDSVQEAVAPGSAGYRRAGSRTAPARAGRAASVCDPIVTEGYGQLDVNTARTLFDDRGSGVTVGVLSDSYDALVGAATDVSNDELPGAGNTCGHTSPVNVLQDYQPGSDEGRAMLQIVHDLAPRGIACFCNRLQRDVQLRRQHPCAPKHRRSEGDRR